jgi:branched-chain amino acid transport system substrate-binding protein
LPPISPATCSDNQGVEMLFDVAASAIALAALEISKARGKINMFNGPARSASPTRPAVPTPCITCSIHSCRPRHGPCGRQARPSTAGSSSPPITPSDRDWKGHHQCGAEIRRQDLGGVRHPLNTSDFSSYLLQAQSSKAKVIGLRTPAATPSTPSSRRRSLV